MERLFIRKKSHKGQIRDLSEEPLASTTSRCGVIDVDVVVLGTHGLLNKRLLEDFSVHLHMILSFYEVALWDRHTQIKCICLARSLFSLPPNITHMTFHLAVFTLAPCEAALPFRLRDTHHSFKKKQSLVSRIRTLKTSDRSSVRRVCVTVFKRELDDRANIPQHLSMGHLWLLQIWCYIYPSAKKNTSTALQSRLKDAAWTTGAWAVFLSFLKF